MCGTLYDFVASGLVLEDFSKIMAEGMLKDDLEKQLCCYACLGTSITNPRLSWGFRTRFSRRLEKFEALGTNDKEAWSCTKIQLMSNLILDAARLGVPEDWIIKFIKQKEAFHKIPTSSVLEAIEELVGDGLIYSFSTNSYKSIV